MTDERSTPPRECNLPGSLPRATIAAFRGRALAAAGHPRYDCLRPRPALCDSACCSAVLLPAGGLTLRRIAAPFGCSCLSATVAKK
mmetsp:Transcript_14065/g.33390  ORF Transcript_14065/g.33390 Transcript_14065/m.33390 type:complete len:86 (-) Transcript_14065:243-500(-)